MHPSTLVALIAVATTVLAVYLTGRRPSRTRAVAAILGAGLLFVLQVSFLVCACRREYPWSEWAAMTACFAIVVAAVGRPWLRRTLALALVAASVVLVH